ncbi:MAG: Gfo/Idh/MocA family oxidoreductase [Planctomycetaceae bacterium]|nr:Gfo/Idh/MocA family oxidoreductase [Planctomycetaceae bacterium]
MADTARPSRRDFLRGTTAAAAGIALAGGWNIARAAHAAGGDELKIALIGCGGRGTGAAKDCLGSCENVRLIAVADAFKDNADRCLAQLRKDQDLVEKNLVSRIDVPEDRIFVGFDAYQKAIAAGPDIVLFATPPGFRPIHYAAAVAAGKHVFMEKPICIDAPGFRSVMETNKAADEKNLRVSVGLQRRHSNEFLRPVKKIQDGSLGRIHLMRAYWNCGPIWVRSRQPGQSEMEYQMRNWYHFVWLCGDHILEQHVHNLDVCNWVKGDHPVEANGMGSCHIRDNRHVGQIYDNHFVEFTYKDGTKLYSQSRQQPDTWQEIAQYFHGDKGVKKLPGNGSDGYVQEHVDLINAIRKNEKLNDGWHAATSSFTGVLGRMATYSGQAVKWDDAVANGPNEMPSRFAFDANPPAMPDKDGNYPVPVPGRYKPY